MPRFLINPSGQTFNSQITTLRQEFEALSNDERLSYRNANARELAICSIDRLLIVAGPGSGKSFLFLARIKYWLDQDANTKIYVSSFVRKLVSDLNAEINNDDEIDDNDRLRVTVSTVHTLARSIIERSHEFNPHVQVISGEWEPVVWDDVLRFIPYGSTDELTYATFTHQLYEEEFDDSDNWIAVRHLYDSFNKFYNAVGFANMITTSTNIVEENPRLVEHDRWIIDEYQDFNHAEDHLIRSLSETSNGILIAGDDDQALYRLLKASHPEIISSYYSGPEFANGMLPFCSRCSYNICLAASSFIQIHRTDSAIDKIFLPLNVDESAVKVQVVATFQPTSAVDYISQFISQHREDLNHHIEAMQNHQETDPFLLILTPEKSARFYRERHADQTLHELLAEFGAISTGHSPDYRKISTYCSISWNSGNNFAIRKGLHYEAVESERVHQLLERAIDEDRTLGQLTDEEEIESLLGIADQVKNILTDENRTSVEKSHDIAAIISLSDPNMLASELARDPNVEQSELIEAEAEDAVESAGSMAAVEMMTMFKSKGLSAKHVIIIGCDDVNLARTDPLTFFVGLTRARKTLHLITSLKAGGSTSTSPFVLELPSTACEYIEYRKTRHTRQILHNRQAYIDLIARWRRATSNHQRLS